MSTPTALITTAAAAALVTTGATSVANIETTVQDAVTVLQNIAPAGSLIAQLYGANFNVTTDQVIPLIVPAPADGFVVRHVVVTNASTSLTTAAGGVYNTASKGGTAIVANTQVYTACTTAAKIQDLTVVAQTSSQPGTFILALTSGQGAAATADIFVYGDPLGA